MNETTIYELVEQAKEVIRDRNLSKKVQRRYQTRGFNLIRSYYESVDQLSFCKTTTHACVQAKRVEYESGTTSKAAFVYLRKAAAILEEISRTGNSYRSRLPNWSSLQKPLCLNFKYAVSSYRDNKKGVLSESTIRTYTVHILQFLRYLEENGRTGFKDMKLMNISAFIPYIANRYPGGLHTLMGGLRSFGKYLLDAQLTDIDITLALLKSRSPSKRVIAGFTNDEIHALLNSPDRNTAIGIRDYAIFVLSQETGLRGIDIINLRLSDIYWTNKEIRIVQKKTNSPLTLPFSVKVGNAIAKYIVNARPDCESEIQHVFLRAIPPHIGLHPRAISAITVRHMQKAGIHYAPEEGRGHHSFRRSIATNMLKESIPLNVIVDVLGQRNHESAKHYLTADEKNLKECALDFQMIQQWGMRV